MIRESMSGSVYPSRSLFREYRLFDGQVEEG